MQEYPSLVSRTHTSDCITISCHNCSTGDIYSVKRPIDSLNQFGDRVIIHKGAIVNIQYTIFTFFKNIL